MTFGEKIRIFRVLRGMTQADLAFAAGSQQSVIARYERGDTIPHFKLLKEIAKELDLEDNISWLRGASSFKYDIKTYRVLSPYLTYISSTIRSIDETLNKLLPKLMDELGIDKKVILKSDIGSVFIGTDELESKAFILILRNEIHDTVISLIDNYTKIDISEIDMVTCLMFTKHAIEWIINKLNMTKVLKICESEQLTIESPTIHVNLEGELPVGIDLAELKNKITELCSEIGLVISRINIVEHNPENTFYGMLDPSIKDVIDKNELRINTIVDMHNDRLKQITR